MDWVFVVAVATEASAFGNESDLPTKGSSMRMLRMFVIVIVGGALLVSCHDRTANTGVLRSQTWRMCENIGGGHPSTGVTHGRGQVNRTVVNSSAVPCSHSHNIVVASGNYVEPWLGLTTCTSGHHGGGCDRKRVALNSRTIPNNANAWRFTASHEFGHVAGLGHRPGEPSPMRNDMLTPITFDAHDIDAINSTYPF